MANMKLANAKSTKICALCSRWYDPTNSAIVPKQPQAGFWEYDHNATRKCMKTGLERPSWASCRDFSCKL